MQVTIIKCVDMPYNMASLALRAMQELLDRFAETQVAYLDLSYYPTDAVRNAGPGACVAGELKLMPGMFGTPSQVCISIPLILHFTLPMPGNTFCRQYCDNRGANTASNKPAGHIHNSPITSSTAAGVLWRNRCLSTHASPCST
jgi:hypothetical protein